VSDFPPVSEWPRLAARLGKAGIKWTLAGFPLRTEEKAAECIDACKTCRHFDGRCKLCGCITTIKAMIATEQCPIEKWPD